MSSQGTSGSTQISAAGHAVALALMKLNRLIPKGLFAIYAWVFRSKADSEKQYLKSRIDQATGEIKVHDELLKLNDDQRSPELRQVLMTRMRNQRDMRPSKDSTSSIWLRNAIGTREEDRLPDQSDDEQESTATTIVTKEELIILNEDQRTLINQLEDKLQSIEQNLEDRLKAALVTLELSCLLVGLLFWSSIVIGLVLGLGKFSRPDSFVTAFTIIISVATAEYDYFRRIVLARWKPFSARRAQQEEQQRLQGRQSVGDEAQPAQQNDSIPSAYRRSWEPTIQDVVEAVV